MSFIAMGARIPIILVGVGIVVVLSFIAASYIAGRPEFLVGNACTQLIQDNQNNTIDTSPYLNRGIFVTFCRLLAPADMNMIQVVLTSFLVIAMIGIAPIMAAFEALAGLVRVRE